MAHNQVHPGVTVYSKNNNSLAQLVRFTFEGTEYRKGLGTQDRGIAENYALEIYSVIQGNYDFSKLSEVTKRILNLKPQDQIDIQSVADALPVFDEEHELTDLEAKALNSGINSAHDYILLERKYKQALHDISILQDKLSEREAVLAQLGRAHRGFNSKKTLKDAIDKFLKNLRDRVILKEIKPDTLTEYTSHFTVFSKIIPSSTLLTDLTSEMIIEFLKAKLPGKNGKLRVPYVKKLSFSVVSLMKDQSIGFDDSKIERYRKQNLNGSKKKSKDYYWIESFVDVLKLAFVAQEKYGKYWSDLILVQYGLAARPEELTFLQSSRVNLEARTFELCALEHNSEVIRDMKNDGCSGVLNYPDYIHEILTRRSTQGNVVLFPKEKGLTKRDTQVGSDFEKENRIWKGQQLWKEYRKVLRTCAIELGFTTPGRMDCRTLRRSRARELILRHQKAEPAAAFLRDGVQMVRDHYARLLPQDVRA